MTDIKRVFFKEITQTDGNLAKVVLLPVSLLFHSIVIAFFLVYPIMSTGEMPKIENYSVRLLSMPKLDAPGIRRGRISGIKKKDDIKRRTPKKEIVNNMVAPHDIPEDIEIPDVFPDISNLDGTVKGGIEDDIFDLYGDPNGMGTGSTIPLTVKNVIKSPRLVKKVPPVYPSVALRARREADIVLEAVTDIYGKVKSVRVFRGDPLLNEAAVNAIMQWIYEPYIINGMPKPVKFTVTISFRLKR